VAFEQGELRDLDRLCEAMKGCDAVLHMAAAADVDEVRANPVDAEDRNARGTLHVLEAARRCEVERVVYASTIWVYSDTEAELQEESLPLSAPAHLYTATKLAGELYCRSYGELYGVKSTILRFGIPYGPRARPAAVIPAFVNKALAGEPLTIAGDGSQSRRFVYVEDLAEGVVRALTPVAAGRIYNLVGNEDVSIKAIAENVQAILGDVEITHVPGRSGDFGGAPVCGEAAARDLDWRPMTSFEEGLRRYVDWHVAAREGALAAAATVAAAEPELAGSAVARSVLRRVALALAWAVAAAVMVVGLASLTPVDQEMDTYDVFTGLLLYLVPLVLAGGFAWDEVRARWLRGAMWTLVAASLAVVAVPWPPLVGHLGHDHPVMALLLALTAGIASQLPGSRAPLRLRTVVAGD
jgi:UDP-glucose 4-epimerase